MKTVFHCDEVEKDTIAHDGHQIDKAERDADPDMVLLKSRDAREGEGASAVATCVVHDRWDLIDSPSILKANVYSEHEELRGNSSYTTSLGPVLLFPILEKRKSGYY